jgi:hypothetical protein
VTSTIARITGTALSPGVSKNGRLYTAEVIKKAVARAQNRIGEGGPPLTMLTHHSAADDSERIVGRVTHISLGDNGAALFKSSVANTPAGNTVASLADTREGDPYLDGVSIRGSWVGPVKHTIVGGRMVEYGDDLEIDGLDFTKSPGVDGANILSCEPVALPTETDTGKTIIYESVDTVTITEETPIEEKGAPALKSGKSASPPTPGASKYADPGYQDDKAKRYPLDSLAHAKAAWSYVSMPKNAAMYTAPQLKQIKGRIANALRKFGVKISAKEGWAIYPLVEESSPVAEGSMDAWPDIPGSYSLSIDNGMVHICISSCRVDPADLEMCARAAMEGACAALVQLDPDMDGDMDTDGKSDDDRTESVTAGDVHESKETNEMTDQPTTPAAEESPPTIQPTGVTLTTEQFQQLLASVTAPAPVSAGATAEAAVVEAPPVTETTEQMVARLVTEGIKAGLATAVQEHVVVHGPPARKGLVTRVTESAGDDRPAGWPTDENGLPMPAHKMTDEQWKQFSRPTIEQAFMGRHSVYAQQG